MFVFCRSCAALKTYLFVLYTLSFGVKTPTEIFTCEQYPSWRVYMDSDITCLCVKVPLVLLERSIKKLQNFFLKIEWKFWIERDIQVFRHFRYFTPQMLRVQSQKSKNIGLLLQHQNVFFEIFWKLL